MNNIRTSRVLLIDPSAVFGQFLTLLFVRERLPLSVVGHSMTSLDASSKIRTLKPDIVFLDATLASTGNGTVLKSITAMSQAKIILLADSDKNLSTTSGFPSLLKPNLEEPKSISLFLTKLSVHVTTSQSLGSKDRVATPPTPSPQSAKTSTASELPMIAGFSRRAKNTLIVMGASTGGTETLLEILKDLPIDTPGIVVTQHMPPVFTDMYAKRIDGICKMEVREAKNGDIVKPGLILISPGGDLQSRIVRIGNQYSVSCFPAEKVSGHRPSVDVLFHSAAQLAKSEAVGVLLTGMGQDGAYGLLEMHKAGAHTIGQDKASSIVYGMPKVAFEIGAVKIQADFHDISGLIYSHLKKL